jgi:hypothetical protein
MSERKYIPKHKIPHIERLREYLLDEMPDKEAAEDYIKALYELPDDESPGPPFPAGQGKRK